MDTITIQPTKGKFIWQRILFLVIPLSLANTIIYVLFFWLIVPERWSLGLLCGLVIFAINLLGLLLGLGRELKRFTIQVSDEALAGPSTGWYRRSSLLAKEIDWRRTERSLDGRNSLVPRRIWSIYGDQIVFIGWMYPPGQRKVLQDWLEEKRAAARIASEATGPGRLRSADRLTRPIVFQPPPGRMAITHAVFALFGSLAGAVGVLLFSREISQILWGLYGGLGGGLIGSLLLNAGSRWRVTISKDTITGNPGQDLLGGQWVSFFIARVDRARTAQTGPIRVLLMSGHTIWSLEDDRIFLPDFFFPPEDVRRILEYIGIDERGEIKNPS